MSGLDREYVIYAHRNKINNKYYVGQTREKPERRWRPNGEGYKNSPKFYSAIKKYGWNNFEHIILQPNLSESQVDDREKFWIKYYNSVENGYNCEQGGSKNKIISEQSRKKMSESAKKRGCNHYYTEEEKQAARERQLGEKNSFYGHHHTDQTRKKMREHSANARQVICLNNNKIFNSAKEAANWCNGDASSIGKVCKGRFSHTGYDPITKEHLEWAYYQEEQE